MSCKPLNHNIKQTYLFCLLLQLQHLVGDDIGVNVMNLFTEERKRNATGGPVSTAQQRVNAEATYQRKAEQLLTEENCFKVKIVSHQCSGTVNMILVCMKKISAHESNCSKGKPNHV